MEEQTPCDPPAALGGPLTYRIECRRAGSPSRLVVAGEIGRSARDDLLSAARIAAPTERGGVLVVDLDGVTLMHPFGARAVMELRSALARNATKLRLVNIPPCVAKTFHTIGVPTMVRGSSRLN
jgi:anti-anti-sigma regulatory factor